MRRSGQVRSTSLLVPYGTSAEETLDRRVARFLDTRTRCTPLIHPPQEQSGRSDRRAAGSTDGAICVQRLDDSLNSAIHTTYRSSRRSSSTHEPRGPPLEVICVSPSPTLLPRAPTHDHATKNQRAVRFHKPTPQHTGRGARRTDRRSARPTHGNRRTSDFNGLLPLPAQPNPFPAAPATGNPISAVKLPKRRYDARVALRNEHDR